MTSVATLLRALSHRAGTTLVVFVVALCATAAATVGPTYYAAARHSILQDTLSTAPIVGRGFVAVQQGSVQGTINALADNLSSETDRLLHGPATTRRLLGPATLALEATRFFSDTGEEVPLVWRSGACGHVEFRSGRCPQAADEIAISTSLAAGNHWGPGTTVRPDHTPALHITGVYLPPDPSADFWFARGQVYFPAEFPSERIAPYDAMFTQQSTIEGLGHHLQGAAVVSRPLRTADVEPGDVGALSRLDAGLHGSPDLSGVAVTTTLQSTVDQVHSSWTSLAVPVVVVTAELLVLTWLLLFLVVTDAVEARGTEIALAKLRGYGAGRSLIFGLGEPAALLGLALPAGAVLGWVLTGVLSRVLLRSGTPVHLPGLGWAAAALAAVGGAAAVVVAARGTLTRPVVEQWRRTGRKATDRGWVFDGIVLTGALAGLLQLMLTGTVGSAKHSALALLVPGLLGIAVAVLASRLLPVLCRAAFSRTRSHGSLGPFLAVRHIVRRPGGTRTTMILAAAVALATFSMSAWSVGNANRDRVAAVTVGAPAVLTVAPAPGTDLGAVVDRIDPGGQHAAAVEAFNGGQTTLLGVQPQRFAAVASWSSGLVGDAGRLLTGLHPPAPPPIILRGEQVRVHVPKVTVHPTAAELTLDVVATGASAPTPVDLGAVRQGRSRGLVRIGQLAACPCTVADLQLSPPAGVAAQLDGQLTLGGIDDRVAGAWRPVPGGTTAQRWVDTSDQRVTVAPSGADLAWAFFGVAGVPPTLRTHDRPEPLPGVVSSALAGTGTTVDASGLDGGDLPIAVQQRARTVPSAPGTGVVVDLDYAERAAYGNVGPSTAQVWVRGPVDQIRHALVAAHVPVLAVVRTSDLAAQLSRQGPGLASVLFLADAAAAAVLAALAAVLSLSVAARRRRYEYAALIATGATRRTLSVALAIEQFAVLGFGALAGIGTGLLAIALAGKSVPEFVTPPVAAPLSYQPSATVLGLSLGLGLVVLFTSAALAAAALLRSVSADQLREAPT